MSGGEWSVKVRAPESCEEEVIAANGSPREPQASGDAPERVLLVNRRGEPLVIERPRPIGFRPR